MEREGERRREQEIERKVYPRGRQLWRARGKLRH